MVYPKVTTDPSTAVRGPACPPTHASPRSRSGSSPTGTRTAPSWPRWRAATAGENGVERVRLLRRAALRQRPAALRAPADRLRQGHRPPLPDDARAPGRAALRLGLPRAARRARGAAPARPQDQGRTSWSSASRGSTRPAAASVLQYTDEWRDYVTRQARWVDFDHDYKTLEPDYMESVLWAFKSLLRQGPGLRGLPGAALLLERRDAAVQPRAADGRRRLPEAAGPGGHGRAAAWRPASWR